MKLRVIMDTQADVIVQKKAVSRGPISSLILLIFFFALMRELWLAMNSSILLMKMSIIRCWMFY